MNPTEGTVLNDRYTLTDRIAAGGMGEVWAATDTVLGRSVAVKLLHPGLSAQSDFVERFRAEARHTAALHHPNIAAVFDYGEDGGAAYLVMELVTGQPLSQIISDRAPLSAQETASILIQAATALEAAHRGGVVHRDVKPANILITPDGRAKLTDFGISRAVDAAPMTQTGQILGTAQYLSPEQAMGQSATASSDIYALGVVGHEMLTGQRPFDADTLIATALAHINRPPPELPDTIPVGVRDVISAALAKNPADRPASAAVMAHALGMPDAAFASSVTAATTPSRTVTTATTPSRTVTTATTPSRTVTAPTVAMAAQAMQTQAMPTQASPTQAMQAMGTPTEPPGTPDRRSGRPVAWFLGAAAVALLAVLAFFLPSDVLTGSSTRTPVSTTTPSPTSTTSSATPSTSAPAVITPPAVTSPVPTRPNKGKGNGDGGNNGNKKEGN
jgi:serine/threonine-protein kinase